MSGNDRGKAIKLLKPRIVIGRNPNCDLVLNDNRCSRKHAAILLEENGVFVENLNPKNKTYIHGQEIQKFALIPGTEIQCGDTSLFFQLEIFETPAPKLQSVGKASKSKNTAQSQGIKPFHIILGLVIAAFAGLLLMDEEKVDNDIQFRNEESIAEEITETFKRKQELETQYYSSGKDSRQYLEAEANYLRGFREYREANYNRAISYFSAALSLYPQHELADRYLKQAHRKREEEIQYTLGMANSLKEKAQYKKAISYYRHVMILVNDNSSLAYKEAQSLLEECQLKLKGGF
ncbi:MAG: FHA domain-containing protein [Bdellovibrionota bacterium]